MNFFFAKLRHRIDDSYFTKRRRTKEINRLYDIQFHEREKVKTDYAKIKQIDAQILACKHLHWSDYKTYARLL